MALDNPWPIPKFSFKVSIDNDPAHFTEVSGLDAEIDKIEYRAGNSPDFSTVTMPGLRRTDDVTLKRGIVNTGGEFWTWLNQATSNEISRRTVTITLQDEAGASLFTWTLANAFPQSISAVESGVGINDAVVENLVLAHEGLTMAAS